MGLAKVQTALPAIEGGIPVRKKFLDFSRPVLTDKEKSAVMEVLDNGWLTSGVKVMEFEKRFAAYIGVKHALAVNSCTAGLFLILKVLGVGPGDEIITSPNTFAATANVVEHLGAKPVFCDIRMSDGNIDPEKIALKVTPRTKGIIAVHYSGTACDMSSLKTIADYYNLFIVGDAAHAVETTWDGANVGSQGIATAYSFYATKNLTTGEGGMIVTEDDKMYEEMKILRLHGLSVDAGARYSKDGKPEYDLVAPGYKFNMPDILASLGIVQLDLIKKHHAIRWDLQEYYRNALSHIDHISPLDNISKNVNAYHLFPVLVDFTKLKCDKAHFMAAMKSENIGVSQHFQPLHLFSYYRNKYNYVKSDFPNAEKFGEQVVSLPFNQYLSKKDIDAVIEALGKIINHYKTL